MMNGPLRKVSVFVALLMAALLVNITYISVFRQDSMANEPRNRRVRDAEFSNKRGAILVGNEPIADSTESGSDRFPYERHYPEGNKWSSVTGWYSYDYARSNLEQSWNKELSGTGSSQTFSRILDIVSGRSPHGANLNTSLHPGAQAAAINALGDQQGAAIAMDYTTGEILALASTPTYDPNRLASLDLGSQRDAWAELLDAPGDPLKNRATREIFPPGSTFKLVTSAAALESGMTPESKLAAPDSLPLPNSSHAMGNSTNCGGTEITLEKALSTSCNTAFGNLGMDLGAEELREMAEKFGFNSEPEIDFPSTTSRFPDELDEAQTALSAIGQYDVASSPLQMLQVTAAIANDGVLMEPHIVSEVTGEDLRVISSNSPRELGRPMSASNAVQLQDMMVDVVENGTGSPAQLSGMRIGGKTGTAQSAKDRPNYAWFVGFAEEPQVAVVAFVQSTSVESNDISGGRVAAPIFRAVMEALR